MKRIGTLALAGLLACAFGATTFTPVSAQAKTHHESDTARKKKKKKKKKHSASASVAKSVAGEEKAERTPASTGYQRASMYMKHGSPGTYAKHKTKKRKKKHSA